MEKKEFSKDNTLALKGIAIIMLLFHHCFSTVSRFENYSVSFFLLTQNFVVEMTLTFKICVSIFAFITGYGLMLSLKKLNAKYEWTKKEIVKWTINRLIKLLSGFWIIAILAYIICQIINGRTEAIFFDDGIIYGIIKMIINFLGLSNLFGLNTFDSTWWYMSIAVLFVFTVPIFMKLLKKQGYLITLLWVMFIPRIIGWKYVNSSYISFLMPLLLGIIFAENNLLVRIANFKLNKNIYANKIIKFLIGTALIIVLYIIYNHLPNKIFWEIRYGFIPVILICYLYEFIIDIPVIKQILKFIGKHSMNIFLIHTFIREYYLGDFIYSFENWIEIVAILFIISLAISIVLELFKKLIRYDKLIKKLQNFAFITIDKIYDRKILN